MSLAIRPWVTDISHYQSVLSFEKAKAWGLVGVIHKATQGTKNVDSTYKRREAPARAAGLLWGAYHFLEPDHIPEQVKHFYETVGPSPSILHAVDHESYNGKEPSIEALAAFVLQLRTYSGRWPLIYSGNVIKEQIPRAKASTIETLKNCKLWLAQYSSSPSWPKSVWELPFLWQFTGDGHGPGPHEIPGISPGKIDIDSFTGGTTKEELIASWPGNSPRPIPVSTVDETIPASVRNSIFKKPSQLE